MVRWASRLLGRGSVVVRSTIGVWHNRDQLVVQLDKYPVEAGVVKLLAHEVLKSFLEL